MPDISNKEKIDIRKLAKCFSDILPKVSFRNGSQIYFYTSKELYKRSARWKYCLLCGKIGLPGEFKSENHNCPEVLSPNIQVVISTSWFKLRDFFLKYGYKKVLEKTGIKNKQIMDKKNGDN